MANPRRSSRISGKLVDAVIGLPLEQFRLTAYRGVNIMPDDNHDPRYRDRQNSKDVHAIPLGEAKSNKFGYFEIIYPLERFQNGTELSYILKIEDKSGDVCHVSSPRPLTGNNADLLIEAGILSFKVSSQSWALFCRRLKANHFTRLNQIARELTNSSPSSLFSDLDQLDRYAIYKELEEAFLDPTGILRNYSIIPSFYAARKVNNQAVALRDRLLNITGDHTNLLASYRGMKHKVERYTALSNVNWVINIEKLADRQIPDALFAHENHYRLSHSHEDQDPPTDFDPGDHDSTNSEEDLILIGYRDYLLDIWSMTKYKLRKVSLLNDDEKTVLFQQLSYRFGQNFQTTETTEQPAVHLMVVILRNVASKIMAIPVITGTLSQQFDEWIKVLGYSKEQLELRYRIDLSRPEDSLTSPVKENIYTLQRFLSDSFQSDPDPLKALIYATIEYDPILIPDYLLGKAPFFLMYEEWKSLQNPIYWENYLDIKSFIKNELSEENTTSIINKKFPKSYDKTTNEGKKMDAGEKLKDSMNTLLIILNGLKAGNAAFSQQQYNIALDAYKSIEYFIYPFDEPPPADGVYTPIQDRFIARKGLQVETSIGLEELSNYLWIIDKHVSSEDNLHYLINVRSAVYYAQYYLIPLLLADTYLELGNYSASLFYYSKITQFAVFSANLNSGHEPYDWNKVYPLSNMKHVNSYHNGDLPYSFGPKPLHYYAQKKEVLESNVTYSSESVIKASEFITAYTHPYELAYFKIKQANAMLEWADKLYRSDNRSNIERARELYKGVLLIHGDQSLISPTGKNEQGQDLYFTYGSSNPAIIGQMARARQALFQMRHGLNYFGSNENIIPTLRYRVLKDAADRLTSAAKGAQRDYIDFMEKIETSIVEEIKNAHMTKKARIQEKIAREQENVAKLHLKQANTQVEQINHAILKKIEEINESEGFWEQIKGFTTEVISSGDKFSKIYNVTKLFSGENLMSATPSLPIGAGFVAFGTMGYMAMDNMADAANDLKAQLNTLRDQALPAALRQVDIQKKQLTIARLHKEIVKADLMLAYDLINFQENKFLNREFWIKLATIMKRVLSRYLDLGTKTAWLAERALGHEQNRALDIIRLDYFPTAFQGILGADLLQLDLAELEAARLEGIRKTIPIKHTYSLLRDFPIQFSQIKQTGQCIFRTTEGLYRSAHPGTYGYRLKNITIQASTIDAPQSVSGILQNQGFSFLSSLDNLGKIISNISIRPPEALPLSEFKMAEDMVVYGLPDEALSPFEGTGVETFWSLQLPEEANPYGLSHLNDILITFDIRASYSPELQYSQSDHVTPKINRLVMLSAQKFAAAALSQLQGTGFSTGKIEILFDIAKTGLLANKKNSLIKNIFLLVPGSVPLTFEASLGSVNPQKTIDFSFINSVASSGMDQPNGENGMSSPLNQFIGLKANQQFKLIIDKAETDPVDFATIADIIFGLEFG